MKSTACKAGAAKHGIKLYAPRYYRAFSCIADRCRHSCCIGWEIDVDEQTLELYRSLSDGYGKTVAESIDEEDVPHFRLVAGERCPHLDEQGLCRIIKSMGEGYLCEICREHPRFYHDTPRGKEVGVGMACEEAARLILQSEDFDSFVEIGAVEGRALRGRRGFDALAVRAELYACLSDRSRPYAERLHQISAVYGVSPLMNSDEAWRALLGDLEYLDDAHRAAFLGYTSTPSVPTAIEEPLCRALAYFIFRHCSATRDADAFRESLGFALFCERLIASVAEREAVKTIDALADIARIVSEELEYSEENTDAIKQVFWELSQPS